MNLGEIVLEVENIVQDDTFDSGRITDYVNNTIKYIADRVNLPGLKGIDTVETELSQNYTSLTGLTDGFSGRLVACLTEDIIIYPTLELLMAEYIGALDEAGDVEGIALEGNTLWYQKIPAAAETLTFVYYQSPTVMTETAHTPPADIPESVHRSLFVNGTAFLIYDQIEDAVEDKKVNAKSHFWQAFDTTNSTSGMSQLMAILARKKVHYISSVWNY